jgi:hypothetical protein
MKIGSLGNPRTPQKRNFFFNVFQDLFLKYFNQNFPIEIFQYTKNLENFNILASTKLGEQVSIGYDVIENGNRFKYKKKSKYGEFWATGGIHMQSLDDRVI